MQIALQFTYIFILLLIFIVQNNSTLVKSDLKIPKNLLIGTASSAYQIEGAWNADGKSENVWDYSIHNYPDLIANHSSGDVAADFYHKYKEDVKLLECIGFDTFRFSISWARILPTGYDNNINKKGLNYYHRVLDELEKRKIKPIVTLYHWDHPKILENFGGWLNERMAYVYADYARVIFREFGHRIKSFSTINEPYIICLKLYNMKNLIPNANHSNKNFTGWGMYQCVHNKLKGHALAYHIYDKEFREKQNGKISLITQCDYSFGENENDTLTADIAFEFQCGYILNAIFSKEGDYPEMIKKRIAERSRLQGYEISRLPIFSKKWIKLLKNSADYLGLNHYTSNIASQLPYSQILEWKNDDGLKYSSNPDWPSVDSNWVKTVPEGFGNLLRKLKDKYNNPPVYVLENGLNADLGIDDDARINHLYLYMKEMLNAINQDGCNVQAYTVWSFLDSFEWNSAYTSKFGLVQVDFNDENRKRTLKKSALWFKTILKLRRLISPTS